MNYGDVLTRAWQIIWKHKVLWVFGILAGLASGGGGGGGGGSNTGYKFDQGDHPFNFGYNIPGYQVERWMEQNWWVFVLLVFAAVLFALVAIVLSTFGRVGLARGAWQADEDKPKLTLGALFGESGRFFWRVLGLNVLIFLMWIAFFLLLAAPAGAFTLLTLGIGLICLIPFFVVLCCLMIPLSWAVSVIVEQSIVAITNEELGLIDGLKRGWGVFRGHLAESTIMFLILGIGGGIVRFIISLPVFLAVLPLITAATLGSADAWKAGGVVSLVLICIYLPVALVLNGVVTSYTGTSWALTFRRLTGREAGSEKPADAALEVAAAE